MTAGLAAPEGGFHGPVKRSVTIAGHETSISLEPLFWAALEREAAARGLPLSALVAAIDALRIGAAAPPNLASALRTWLFARRRDGTDGPASRVGDPAGDERGMVLEAPVADRPAGG